MSRSVRILVIDDDEPVRDALTLRLRADNHQVQCFGSAMELLETVPLPEAHVAFVDVRMPGMNGLELLSRLNKLAPAMAVVMISGHGDVPMAVRAMQAGAVDFIEKPFEDARIVSAIDFATSIAESRQMRSAEVADAHSSLDALTPRERETMELVVSGLASKEIAKILDISPRTVEIHRQRVMQKTGAKSVAQLVRIALTAGVDIASNEINEA